VVHLLLLGAVSTAILIWSQHFADTLLRRSAAGGRISLGARLAVHTVGAVSVLIGIVGGWWPIVLIGGILVGANALAHSVILVNQSRGAPSPPGSPRWCVTTSQQAQRSPWA
jgi:nitrite reductase (NO-forming)